MNILSFDQIHNNQLNRVAEPDRRIELFIYLFIINEITNLLNVILILHILFINQVESFA